MDRLDCQFLMTLATNVHFNVFISTPVATVLTAVRDLTPDQRKDLLQKLQAMIANDSWLYLGIRSIRVGWLESHGPIKWHHKCYSYSMTHLTITLKSIPTAHDNNFSVRVTLRDSPYSAFKRPKYAYGRVSVCWFLSFISKMSIWCARYIQSSENPKTKYNCTTNHQRRHNTFMLHKACVVHVDLSFRIVIKISNAFEMSK